MEGHNHVEDEGHETYLEHGQEATKGKRKNWKGVVGDLGCELT